MALSHSNVYDASSYRHVPFYMELLTVSQGLQYILRTMPIGLLQRKLIVSLYFLSRLKNGSLIPGDKSVMGASYHPNIEAGFIAA